MTDRGTLPDAAGSYAALVACCGGARRVLELGCGARRVDAGSTRTVAVDSSGGHAGVRAAGEALPFADASFDRVIAHLALDVITDCDAVMRELDRVLADDGEVAAVVGGGPAGDADDGDAYVALAAALARDQHGAARPRAGDRRVRDEAAWRAWWPRHRVSYARHEACLRGDVLIPALSRLARIDEAAARRAIGTRRSARVVTWLVRVQR